MKNKFRLIQRGKFCDLTRATKFLGESQEHLIDLDYMGAAEFEWGTIPKAYRRIMGQFDKYSLHVTDLFTVGGVPFCVYCRDDRYEKILEAIKLYLNEDYRLEEWTNMHAHFTEPNGEWEKAHHKWQLQTNFWWCIDVSPIECKHTWDSCVGDWIAFTGASDRQNAFKRVIQSDYDEWWSKMSTEEQTEEFDKAFERF